jgi:hypothetical protein
MYLFYSISMGSAADPIRNVSILFDIYGQCCGSGPFWSDLDPDPDVWYRIQIRILALINDPISTFLVCVHKSHNYFRITCRLTFWFVNILFKAYFGSCYWIRIVTSTGGGVLTSDVNNQSVNCIRSLSFILSS